jgi:anti-sigma28 factor (negative regulator of flagellin synthesis)
MKFGVTGIERRHTRTSPPVPAKQQSNQNTGTSTTSWEERIAHAKKLTISRRTGEQTEANAEKSGAAYLHWLEQRTARIENLRARIETGTYHIDSATLAEDMVRNASRDCEDV